MGFFQSNKDLRDQEQKMSDSTFKVNAFFRLLSSIETMMDTRLYATVDNYSWSKCPMNTREIRKLSSLKNEAVILLQKAKEEQEEIRQELKQKRIKYSKKEVNDG